MSEKKRDLRKAGKYAIVELVRLAVIGAGFILIGRVLPEIPWQITAAVYVAGCIVMHFNVFRGMAGNPPPTWRDIHLYARDSGIPLVVFMWPAMLFFVFGPEAVEHALKKRLGLELGDPEPGA